MENKCFLLQGHTFGTADIKLKLPKISGEKMTALWVLSHLVSIEDIKCEIYVADIKSLGRNSKQIQVHIEFL